MQFLLIILSQNSAMLTEIKLLHHSGIMHYTECAFHRGSGHSCSVMGCVCKSILSMR